MAGSTPYLGLAYFDFRDRLDTGINVQKEIDRFLIIDRQLFGLYSIFGDGTIEGWDVSALPPVAGQTISVVVSLGLGIISSLAVETFAPVVVADLPANETVNIYAVLSGGTTASRQARFVFSRSLMGSGAVRLATVTTGNSDVASVDLSAKEEIGFLEIIKDEISKHKHRGVPSKIDLQQEVRNQLPGARIEDFDASKIQSGRFDKDRIPILDHNDLDNNGLLTHPALDSFVRTLTSGNRELLGEVASVNLMKHLIFLRYLYAESDQDLVNTLLLLPGYTPNSFIDFDASTAYINLKSSCISGLPVKKGEISSIIWDTTSAFLSASDRSNVTIGNDEVLLLRGGGSSRIVENFEQVAKSDADIPGFSKETTIIVDNLTITSESADTLKTEGFYSGKFNVDRQFRALYTKDVTKDQDWSIYDELVFDIKSLSLTHGAVYCYFINGTGNTATKSPNYLLLGADEVTTNPDSQQNGFERRSFAINNVDRNNVTKIVIYTDDTKNIYTFWIDNVFVRNQALFPPDGFIRFRYSGGVNLLFSSLSYKASVPDGSEIRVRIRVASSPSLLLRASFTPLLNSGDVFSLEGTDAEIDIVFVSSNDRTKTPVLTNLELQIVVSSSEEGFIIGNADGWDRGSYINMQRNEDQQIGSSISIKEKIAVGDFYFSNLNVIQEIDPDNIAVYGFSGSTLLLSPRQVVNYNVDQGQTGFKNPFSVYRLINKNLVIADTANDRIIELTSDGEFVRGVGSHNIVTESLFYPMSAVYNPRTGIVSSLFSKSIDIATVDISKITLWIGATSIDMGINDTVLSKTNVTKRILEILLSQDKIEQLRDTQSDVFIQFNAGAFPNPFEQTESSRNLYGNRGLQAFVGDFVYMDGIKHPIFANLLENTNWIIGNSSIPFEEKVVDQDQVGKKEKNVKVGGTIQFTVDVDKPKEEGITIVWGTTVPIEIQSITTFTSVDNIGTFSISPTNDQHIGEWTVTFIAQYVGPLGPTGSTQQSVRIVVSSADAGAETGEVSGESPSVIEIDVNNENIVFSYNDIKFSDYSLGSVYEIDDNQFLVAGIISLKDFMPGTGGLPPEDETFEQEAARVLEQYRGKVIILDRHSKTIAGQYDTPDGSYASDAVIDDNLNYVVAETSFVSNAGRIVKLDSFFNIIWQIGGGLFSKINDVRSQINNDIVIST